MCFFSQTFALHRPTNGAAAIIANETANAMCIQHLLSPQGLTASFGLNRQLDCKILHVATVDSLLSPRRTSLDIPPSCYVPNRSGIHTVSARLSGQFALGQSIPLHTRHFA